LFPHTYEVRDYAPKLATSLERVLVSDVVSHRAENGELVRQLFQGKLNVDVRFASDPPCFASVQAGGYRADKVMAGSAAVEKFTPEIGATAIRRRNCSSNGSAPWILPGQPSSFQ
jgi:electron transfer flavoprotein alpha subunit